MKNYKCYTPEQCAMIIKSQTIKNSLSTEIVLNTGIKANELFSLRKSQIPPEENSSLLYGHSKPPGVYYDVTNTNKVIRQIVIPFELSERLEKRQIPETSIIVDDIEYKRFYNIGAGRSWGASFNTASKRTLGWSRGASGLKQTFEIERISFLQENGADWNLAKKAVARELGNMD